MLLCSEKTQHTLICEWKSGKNTEDEQNRDYATIRPLDLTQNALVSASAAKTFDVAIFGRRENEARLRIGIENKYSFPLILVDGDGLHLVLNRFQSSDLNTVFSPSFLLDMNAVPSRFVPIGEDSTEAETAKLVMPRVISLLIERPTKIASESICDAICPVWSACHAKAKQLIRSKVCKVMEQAAAKDFQKYFVWSKSNNGCNLSVIENPIAYKADKRNAAFRKLSKIQGEFVGRLEAGRMVPRQGLLFGEGEGVPPAQT